MIRRTLLVSAATLMGAAILWTSSPALGQVAPVRLVLKGHDPVAYFTDGKPVKGDPRISYDWDEGRYYFATNTHRELFASDPDRYAPQFSGYCTGSMSRGVRNEGHPEAWIIVDGRLYVFGATDSATALKMRESAQKDLAGFTTKVAKATQNWQRAK
jgi:YHS domain-containing protein